jgi:hypothetical protein
MCSGCNLALEMASLKDRDGINVIGKWRRVWRRTELSWEGQMYQLLLCGGLSTCFKGVDKWFPWLAKNETILPVHVVWMKLDLTSEMSVDNHFTRQYNPEDSSEYHVYVFVSEYST